MVMNRLEAAEGLLENQDPIKQSAIIQIREIFIAADVKDPGMPVATEEALVAPEMIPQDILSSAISEYINGPLTPELVDDTWKTIWETWGTSIRHTFQVPRCDRTSEELEKLFEEGSQVLLVPDELYTKEGLELVKSIFRIVNWPSSSISNQENKGGCIDIEMTLDSPYRNTKENKAMGILKKEKRAGQRLATYLVGSHFIYLQRSHYFDENTFSCLPGSRDNNNNKILVNYRNGKMHLGSSTTPNKRYLEKGLRSEGRKKSLAA